MQGTDEQHLRLSISDAVKFATDLHRNGELVESEILYRDILKAEPDHPDVHHFLGVLLHQNGDSDAAIASIRRALEIVPHYPDALNNLGNVFRETGRLEDAEKSYRKVLETSPEHADTLVNLGTILRRLKKFEEAIETIQSALKVDPEHAKAYQNLGNAYFSLGRIEEALDAYRKFEEFEPDNSKSRKEIARVMYLSGRQDEAIEIMRRLVERYPDDEVVRHSLAAYTGAQVPSRASDDYIRDTFNGFSRCFDEVLARLDYKAPELVADAVKDLAQRADTPLSLLDIGCGTGLCGKLVRPDVDKLTGVDLSPGMLRKAQLLGVYDMLEEAELCEYMAAHAEEFDVVTCVDTFVYFGELAEAFQAMSGSLRSGGQCVFTVERHLEDEQTDGYWLQHHGRYSHSHDYIEEELLTAGFSLVSKQEVVLRKENGKPVNGLLTVAKKND